MLVLGIESTCDETGCAVVEDGKAILSNVVYSQAALHEQFGGVVPEIACRRHITVFQPLLERALEEAGVAASDLDLIAVARGPGLIGAILVGLNFAKGLSFSLGKPYVGVNHIEAHLYAALMEQEIPLPALGVVLSGGHTALIKIEKMGDYTLVGQTQDDAIGEAFDKVAVLLGLPYPGGPAIEQLARQGDPNRYSLPSGKVKKSLYDFSFSGLKTAVLYLIKGQNATKHSPLQISEEEKKHVAASFQEAALSDVVSKSIAAAREYGCRSLLFGGGVTNNQALRAKVAAASPLPAFWPPEGLSLDNAAMIAGLGFHQYTSTRQGDRLDLEALPRIPL